MKSGIARILTLIFISLPVIANAEEDIFSKTFGQGASKTWTDYLTDDAGGSVSAAGMLDTSGDSITTVENVRDLVVAVKGISAGDTNSTLAFSITPARTSLAPMNLVDYVGDSPMSVMWRILGSTTFGYAQGDATLLSNKYERRAASIETSFYFSRKDDPIVAVALAACRVPLEREEPPQPPAAPPVAGENPTPGSQKPAEAPQKDAEAIRARATSCRESTINGLRWNRSRMSVSYATGWMKQVGGTSQQQSMGEMGAVGVTYGFDQVGLMKDNWQVTATYRQTQDEPDIASLGTGTLITKDHSTTSVQLAGGSKKVRALVQYGSVEDGSVTVSQRLFKRAVGLDVRVRDATWLNFRLGTQRKIDGTADEIGSLISLSYSPSALLN